jgi:membrane protein implicated in regulation of membrane protease activity
MRRLLTGRSRDLPLPAHAYRDAALAYGGLALIVVLLAVLTGGDILRAVLVAFAFWVVATGWSWWRFRARNGTDETSLPRDHLPK